MKGKEPFEMYTNLGFTIVGIIVYLFPPDWLWEGYALPFCFGAQAISAGSFIYHKYKQKPIYLFDWWAMMFLISICTGILADNSWGWVFVLTWQTVYSYFIMGKLNVFIEVGMSALPLVVAVLLTKTPLSAAIILFLFGIAVYIRSKDPDPKQAKVYDSWQHGVWHILVQVDLGLIMYLE